MHKTIRAISQLGAEKITFPPNPDGHTDRRTDICFYRVALLLKKDVQTTGNVHHSLAIDYFKKQTISLLEWLLVSPSRVVVLDRMEGDMERSLVTRAGAFFILVREGSSTDVECCKPEITQHIINSDICGWWIDMYLCYDWLNDV